jgi:hypothetical protein
MAKVVTGRDKDLSANRKLFVKAVNASDAYKRILKEYLSYANQYRHGADQDQEKPPLTPGEVESFVYLTGMFIRLAMLSDIE